MGVRGLWTYCKENLSSCAKPVDLIRVARQRHGTDILVDLCAFQVFLSSEIFEALANVTDNPYLEILGGEYGAIDAYTSKLISDLRSLGIELIFFVDGCQGSSLEVNVRKTPVWKERYENCVEVQRNTIRMCAGDIGLDDLTNILDSHLTTLQFTSTLEACGCRVHEVLEEADTFIAKTFETMENAYAVLTNDTDFCIFNGCISIFNDLFDVTDSLKPEPGATVPAKPKELICFVFKSEVIGKSLGFQHHSQLIELSIIAGNDNTGRFMREFRYLLSMRGRFSMQKAANWVKEYGRVENHPGFAKKLDQFPAFRQAVEDSRLFYLLQCCEPDGDKGEVYSLLNDDILRGSLPSELLAIHNRVFWRSVSIEQPSLCGHTSDTALTELRRRIYRMVLPENVDSVDEFGLNSQGNKCECISFQHHSQLIELSIIAGNDNTGRFMREFRYLLSMRGRFSMQKAANWVKEYGRVENHPGFAKKLDQFPAFRQAVEDSRLFYLLQCCEPDGDKGEVYSLLNDDILRGSLPSELLAIHNRVFWRSVSIEQPSLCGHTSDTALTELRRRIYRMVLPENVDSVDEFGLNSQGNKCECISVKAINDERVPHICSIQQDAIHENLLHFEWMITHLEGGAVKSWFEMFERKEGFLCYILRYFLLLNWKHNLCITEMEFCALVALVFGYRDERWYQGLSLKPSPRCVTMSAWFQSLYMHAYVLLGGALYLTKEFPTPADVFSGAVWTAYYKCSTDKELPKTALRRCRRDLELALRLNRDIIRELSQDVFDCDDLGIRIKERF